MGEAGRRLHPDAGVRWVDDRVAALDSMHALGLSFDVALLSAVWQHVAPGERQRALRKLATLLKPGGLMVVTLRVGPAPADGAMHEVSLGDIEGLTRGYVANLSNVCGPDHYGTTVQFVRRLSVTFPPAHFALMIWASTLDSRKRTGSLTKAASGISRSVSAMQMVSGIVSP